MSLNTLELVLYELGTNRVAVASYKEDSVAFLSRRRLLEEERAMILNGDVAAMRQAGANPMLLMGYWLAVNGAKEMGRYLGRMKEGVES